jgi:hypothetical protein
MEGTVDPDLEGRAEEASRFQNFSHTQGRSAARNFDKALFRESENRLPQRIPGEAGGEEAQEKE